MSCISPKTAIAIAIPLPFLMLVFYALLEKDNVVNGSGDPRERKEIEYTIVGSTSDSEDKEETFSACNELSCSEKLRIGFKILPFMIALFLSFFSEYLSISSVVTTIAFPNSRVLPRDHYVFYTLSYGIGKFVGRGYLFFFAFLPPDAMEFLKCPKTWIFTGRCSDHDVRNIPRYCAKIK